MSCRPHLSTPTGARRLDKPRLAWLLGLVGLAASVACADPEPKTGAQWQRLTATSDAQLGRIEQLLTQEDAGSEPTFTESCEALEGGGQFCTYDDGAGTTCEVLFAAGDVFSYQSCDGEWGSYDCVVSFDATITCELALTDGSHCTDHFAADGEYLDGDCGSLGDGGRGEPAAEECTEESDGTFTCVYSEIDYVCTAHYDAQGYILTQTCEGQGWSYDCVAVGEQVACAYAESGVVVCEDLFTSEGEPIELGCPWDEEGSTGSEPSHPAEPSEPQPTEIIDECQVSSDGSQWCTRSDGFVTCNDSFSPTGVLVSSSCWTNDCAWSRSCNLDGEILSCSTFSVAGTCNETFAAASGDLLSSDCDGAGSILPVEQPRG